LSIISISAIIGSMLVASVAAISLFILGNSSANHTDSQNFLSGISIPANRYLKAVVSVNGFKLIADLALTQDQQTKGLAVRNHIKESEGMLFVFQYPSKQSFWMKDMKFPIDIIWLGGNRSVVYIVPNLEPCPSRGNCPGYVPDRDSLYVLETAAGFSHRHNVAVGTQTDFKLLG
jgi:uncharacterized membrane protein (UPF0127 family)